MTLMITRLADLTDLKAICQFTDFWLSGRGKAQNAPGAVNDYFISPSQHRKYIFKYNTFLVLEYLQILAWAVQQYDKSLIHFLVAGDRRGRGIGTDLLKLINPPKIRSKLDQSSGDPGPFYEKRGYVKTKTIQSFSRFDIDIIRPHREKTIDIFELSTEGSLQKS